MSNVNFSEAAATAVYEDVTAVRDFVLSPS